LQAIVRQYLGDELVWDVNLVLKRLEVPAEITLGIPETASNISMNGMAQLGWSMWLGPRGSDTDAGDLMLNPYLHVVN